MKSNTGLERRSEEFHVRPPSPKGGPSYTLRFIDLIGLGNVPTQRIFENSPLGDGSPRHFSIHCTIRFVDLIG